MLQVFSITADIGLTNRLSDALEGLAGVVRVDPTADAVRQMAISMRPDLMVVDFTADSSGFLAALGLVRALRQADPAARILGIGEDCDAAQVLAAVRAGVCDFLAHGAPEETLRAQIRTQLEQAARRGHGTGRLTVIKSGQPNEGEGLFAVNLAVAHARRRGEALLLDFHLPGSIAGPALDLALGYTVRDAVHDLPRLDRTLLSTVLGRHAPSGLAVLPLALGAQEAVDITGGDILSLLGTLRGLFDDVIVNLSGVQHPELLATLAGEADRFLLVAAQLYSSVKACRDMLSSLPPADLRTMLVVTEYDPAILLSDAQMRTTLGIAHSLRLPRARAALANAANRGVPLVLDQPKSPYSRAIAALAGGDPLRQAAGGTPGAAAPARRRGGLRLPALFRRPPAPAPSGGLR